MMYLDYYGWPKGTDRTRVVSELINCLDKRLGAEL